VVCFQRSIATAICFRRESTWRRGRRWSSGSDGRNDAGGCSTVLAEAIDLLAAAGCERVWLNGSFVTAKAEPGDFDACWETDGVDLDAPDPVILDLSNRRAAQKARFGGELFPNVVETQSGLSFAEFFQNERDTSRKGIVVIHLTTGDGQ
jgi:hypothetical protein